MQLICNYMLQIWGLCQEYARNKQKISNYIDCISRICKQYSEKICRNMQVYMQNMHKSIYIYCIYMHSPLCWWLWLQIEIMIADCEWRFHQATYSSQARWVLTSESLRLAHAAGAPSGWVAVPPAWSWLKTDPASVNWPAENADGCPVPSVTENRSGRRDRNWQPMIPIRPAWSDPQGLGTLTQG